MAPKSVGDATAIVASAFVRRNSQHATCINRRSLSVTTIRNRYVLVALFSYTFALVVRSIECAPLNS